MKAIKYEFLILTFDSPVYSRKTRIDLDIRVVNCTHVHICPYTYNIAHGTHPRNAYTKCVYIHIIYILYVYII